MEFLSLQCSRSLSQESHPGLKDKSSESSNPEHGARAVFCFLSGKVASSYPQSRERSISCFSSRKAGNSYLEQKAEEVSSSTWLQVVLPIFSPSQAIFTPEFSLAGCVQAISHILIFKSSLEFFLAATPPYCRAVSSSADSEGINALLYDSFRRRSRRRSAHSAKRVNSPMKYILLAMVFILILIK